MHVGCTKRSRTNSFGQKKTKCEDHDCDHEHGHPSAGEQKIWTTVHSATTGVVRAVVHGVVHGVPGFVSSRSHQSTRPPTYKRTKVQTYKCLMYFL